MPPDTSRRQSFVACGSVIRQPMPSSGSSAERITGRDRTAQLIDGEIAYRIADDNRYYFRYGNRHPDNGRGGTRTEPGARFAPRREGTGRPLQQAGLPTGLRDGLGWATRIPIN